MKIANMPQLRAEILAQPRNGGEIPGFIVNGQSLLGQSPALTAAIDKYRAETRTSGAPCVVVGPREIPAIFRYQEEIDLLRRLAGLAIQHAHPHLKTGIDALFLIYGANALREEWKQPDRNAGACFIKLLGLGLETSGVLASAYPGLQLSDSWKNGLNFVAISGGALVEGKTLPINELALSTDERAEIPLKILKAAGIALDPDPSMPGFQGSPLVRDLIATIGSKNVPGPNAL